MKKWLVYIVSELDILNKILVFSLFKNNCLVEKYSFWWSTYYELKAMEFQFRVVVTSECANKMLRAPTPSCYIYKQVNTQPYYKYPDCQKA